MILRFNVLHYVRKFSIYQLEGGEVSGGGAGEAAPSAPSETPSQSATPDSSTPSTPASVAPAAAAEEWSVDKYLDRPVKVKVNGQEKEIPLSRVLQDYQTSQAAQEKFTKAAEMQKQYEGVMASFQKNPAEALKAFGIDTVQFAQQQLEQYIKSQEESPEQKELRELKAYKESIETEKLTAKEQAEMARQEREVEVATQELQTKIVDAMSKYDLPKDYTVISNIANYLQQADERGIAMTESQAAALVKEDMQNNYRHILNQMTPEQIYKHLGDDMTKKLRQYDLAQLKSPTQEKTGVKADVDMAKPVRVKQAETLDQMNRRLRKEFGGL